MRKHLRLTHRGSVCGVLSFSSSLVPLELPLIHGVRWAGGHDTTLFSSALTFGGNQFLVTPPNEISAIRISSITLPSLYLQVSRGPPEIGAVIWLQRWRNRAASNASGRYMKARRVRDGFCSPSCELLLLQLLVHRQQIANVCECMCVCTRVPCMISASILTFLGINRTVRYPLNIKALQLTHFFT